jgi:LmbE family N-acetylglucosaminyl deacetylase
MKILIIAAHPDDEVLGCGGTIAKLSENCDTYVLIVTEGSTAQYTNKEMIKLKKEEAKKVKEVLNIKKYFFGDLPDMKLDILPHVEINKVIEETINTIKPEIVFTHHWGDVNKDHKLIYESTLVAARPVETNNFIRKIYCYEILSASEWNLTSHNNFIPNVWIDIEKYFHKKIEAVKLYQRELRKYPHPRSIEGVEIWAKYRGLMIGKKYAEAFFLVREIV